MYLFFPSRYVNTWRSLFSQLFSFLQTLGQYKPLGLAGISIHFLVLSLIFCNSFKSLASGIYQVAHAWGSALLCLNSAHMMAPAVEEDGPASPGAGLFTEGDLPENSDSFLDSPVSSQHDSDEDFSVQGVLAEGFDGDERLYLIQWAGYGEEDWSWEPKENLSPECLNEWAQTKARQQRGEIAPFDVEQWERNCEAIRQKKFKQHQRRNWARKRRGLELNLYPGETLADYDDGGEAAGDDDFNEIVPPPRRVGEPYEPDTATASPPPASTATSDSDVDESRKSSTSNEELPSNVRRLRGGRLIVDQTRDLPDRPTGANREGSERRPQLTVTTTSHRGAAGLSARAVGTQRAGGSTPSLPHPKTSGLANAPLRAKKSSSDARKRPARSSTGNIFVSGKPPPMRQRYENIVSDSTKAPRLFPSRSIIRRAEIRSRDIADRAPPNPVGIGLFPISASTVPSPRPAAAATDTISPSQAAPEPVVISLLDEPVKSALKKRRDFSPTEANSNEEPPRKKPRVRFTEVTADAPDSTPASPDECDPLAVNQELGPGQQRETGIAKPAAVQTLRRVSFQDGRPRDATRSLNKTVQLGPAESREIDVVFDGIPLESEQLVPSFATAPLVFSHVCTAKDFGFQCNAVPDLRARTLACGSVTSQAHASALDLVADQLRLGSFGLVSFHADFYVVVYPTRCEDWKHSVPEAEPVSPAGVTLKHMVLQSGSREAARGLAIPPTINYDAAMQSDKTRVQALSLFFGLHYDQLLPPALRSKRRTPSFFLAFPPSRRSAYNLLCAWLRDAKPTCRIFSSSNPGDWRAFIDISAAEGGCIIIHEAATSMVRLFPDISGLLFDKDNSAFSFWRFGEGLQELPSCLSLNAHSAYPGQFRFSRLFPHGNVILLTPSFLIAQPCRARQLVSRYHAKFDEAKFYIKLAVSENISTFLEDVALDKLEERQRLKARQKGLSTSEAIAEERRLGLTMAECTARFELLALSRKLMEVQNNMAGREPFVLVDKNIDANDEQSMVNWFGWWSQTNLDQFRKFYVLGSHDDDCERAAYRLPIPRYAPGTIGNPDLAFQQGEMTADSSPPRAGAGFSSTRLRNGDASSFNGFLSDVDQAYKHQNPFIKLYAYAVSYFQTPVEMADHFGDLKMDFESYRGWFNFGWSFTSRFNTYVGLFYTIESAWDPKMFRKNEFPLRHPWIAVYRLRNPHLPKRTATELIIWDADAPRRFPEGSTVYKSKLIPAQQALIDLVESKGPAKNPGKPLERVWLGGYQSPAAGNPSTVDVTLDMLDALMRDTRTWLPAPETRMGERGFKVVELKGPGAATDPGRMDLDLPWPGDSQDAGAGTGKETTIIFYPPRSIGATAANSSECRNGLFLRCVGERTRDKKSKRIHFNFPTTLKWYMRQKAEGRHFEHIRFETWEGIFKALGIGTGGKDPGSAGAKASSASSGTPK
ncbi:hypothetical protein ACRALDRAFT_1094568 [Sodiomyces alcalophilus JCM 7366]|uniref:uncharacterized protein n=1 Tax=Sodiomyces alcalophilus JCM 7366 TaxID=591952 RepID=UPI0039B662FF